MAPHQPTSMGVPSNTYAIISKKLISGNNAKNKASSRQSLLRKNSIGHNKCENISID